MPNETDGLPRCGRPSARTASARCSSTRSRPAAPLRLPHQRGADAPLRFPADGRRAPTSSAPGPPGGPPSANRAHERDRLRLRELADRDGRSTRRPRGRAPPVGPGQEPASRGGVTQAPSSRTARFAMVVSVTSPSVFTRTTSSTSGRRLAAVVAAAAGRLVEQPDVLRVHGLVVQGDADPRMPAARRGLGRERAVVELEAGRAGPRGPVERGHRLLELGARAARGAEPEVAGGGPIRSRCSGRWRKPSSGSTAASRTGRRRGGR